MGCRAVSHGRSVSVNSAFIICLQPLQTISRVAVVSATSHQTPTSTFFPSPACLSETDVYTQNDICSIANLNGDSIRPGERSESHGGVYSLWTIRKGAELWERNVD